MDKIPLGLRIIGVADSIDAMISERPYRKAMLWEDCMDEVKLNKGTQFDPAIVEAVEKLLPEWKERWQRKQF